MKSIGHRAVLCYITSFFALIILGGVVLQSSFAIPSSLLHRPLALLFLISWLWMLISWRVLNRTLIDFYGLFLIAAGLFNGGQAFLEVFDLNSEGFLRNRFDDGIVFSTLAFTSLAFLGMHTGAIFGFFSSQRQLPLRAESDSIHLAMRLVGVMLLAITIYPTALELISALNVASQVGYFGLYQREAATGISRSSSILAQFFVPAILLLLAGSRRSPIGILVATALILSYTASYFAMGYRGWAVLPLIAFIWVWDKAVFRLPRGLLLIAGSVLLFFVFPLIKVMRHLPGESRWSVDQIVDRFLEIDNPIVAILSEMGGSMRTIAETIRFVPAMRDFDYGLSYLYSALTVIPNIFGAVHPTIERGTPSDWITRLAEPIIWELGGGLGYSFVAEAFLNFGWVGGMLFLGVFGLVIGRVSSWATQQRHPLVVAGIGIYMSFFLFYARGDSTLLFRPLAWYTLLPILAVVIVTLLIDSRKKRRDQKRDQHRTLNTWSVPRDMSHT